MAVRQPLYNADATIVLVGMRGVGKTTLALIASTSLRRAFVDADSAFQTLHGCSIASFVNTHGWPAFRDAETVILRKLLAEHPTGYVIACGGGVVEREENRELLARFRNDGHPIVHVIRDKTETVRYLVDETRRPSWGEEIRTVWARREPWFESLCTHTIASLMANPAPSSPQFLMKHVETAFVRLLRSIFGFASSHVPLLPGPRPPPVTGLSSGEYGGYGASESELGRAAKGARTSFVALNFPDLMAVSPETIQRVAGGVDCVELRVDTLRHNSPQTPPDSRHGSPGLDDLAPDRLSSKHYVGMCFGHLRRCTPLPILYTVRTTTQGGDFPDPYTEHPEMMDEYLALLELGFKLGAEYVDIELALPDDTITRLLSLRGSATQCLGADHDRRGLWKWSSHDVLDKYLRAVRLGCDVVKLVSYPSDFQENIELLNFRRTVHDLSVDGTVARVVPLLAINLGKSGQMSRFLNPVFTPVTHPLLPGVAAPGQLTYAQTQSAMFLSGLILGKTFHVPSVATQKLFSQEAQTLGLPYTFIVQERFATEQLEVDYGGSFLGKIAVPIASVQSSATSISVLSAPASSSGWSDLVVPLCTEPTSYDVPPQPVPHSFRYTNVRVLALAEIITQNLSPINAVGLSTAALLIGLSGKDHSEVIEALRLVGARFALSFNVDSRLTLHRPTENGGPDLASHAGPWSARSATQSQMISRPQTPSTFPYPQQPPLSVERLSTLQPAPASLPIRKPPTIIVSGLSVNDELFNAIPDFWFNSPTGGCALDLAQMPESAASTSSNANASVQGLLSRAIIEPQGHGSRRRGGWQLLCVRDLHAEVARQAFKALTGRRMS
ncbi:hypothetical protein OIV83_005147 [Microbotryomycetes sp. JL201]|nr:hypothetical protein OIV83_005147 [Microbotryomycetes sp. JL201]